MPKPMRLGISSSAFVHVMPREVIEAMWSFVRTGSPGSLDDHCNALMAEFTSDMMDAINPSEISALECYHSNIWDADQVLAPILDKPNVEFWSVHAPYGSAFDPSSPEREIRDAAIKAYCGAIDVARRLGAEVVVAHPGADSEYDMPKLDRLSLVPDIIATVADYAADFGIKIAVEPLPRAEPGSTLEEVIWILDQLDRPNVGINFDVNHLFPAAAIPGLIRKAGTRILSVHVSDQDDTERHWLPFEGKLNWSEVLGALNEIGYAGPLIYETHITGAKDCQEITSMVVGNYRRLIGLPVASRSSH